MIQNPQKKSFLYWIYQVNNGRTIATMIFAAVFCLYIGSHRNIKFVGMAPGAMTIMKFDWHKCADVVIAGNSRSRSGLSPCAMKTSLPNMRILNYGFGSAGYSILYLRAVEDVLDPESKRKIIILDISPKSLTPLSIDQNEFISFGQKRARDKFIIAYFGRLLNFFEPIPITQLFRILRGKKTTGSYIDEYHPDGWHSTQITPSDTLKVLAKYRDIFTGVPSRIVSQQVVDQLITYVAIWKKKGIEVYALRIPTIHLLTLLENERARFDEDLFAARFQKAGGTWLPLDQQHYETYDGSHLQRDAAVKLSMYVAKKIARNIETK